MELSFIIFLGLLCSSAFFSASETALFSLSRLQIHNFKKSKNIAAKLVVKCLEEPRQWLATILLGNELVNVLISILGASIVNYLLGSRYSVEKEMLVSVVILTPVLIFFGDVVPKNIAVRISAILAPIVIIPLSLFHKLVKPFRVFLTKIADTVVVIFGGKPESLSPMVMEEEFRRLIDMGSEKGVIDEEEREIIHNVFDFSEKTAGSVMTPIGNVFMLSVETPYEEMLSQIRSTLFSRIPIFENNVKNIIGILHVRDLFAFHKKKLSGGEQDIRTLLREPLFVSKDEKLETLLRGFQKARVHMAIVKDNEEVLGVVTMDDVLEEIFGEMEKE